METQNLPKRLVPTIEAYRAAKKAGNIAIIPRVDDYGNVALATEQIVHEPFTHEQSINVVANITSETIKDLIEKTTAFCKEGDNQNPNETGVDALLENAKRLRKQADDAESTAKIRSEKYGERIADLEAWLHDAEEVEKVEKEKYQQRISETAKALEKVVEKSTAKKNA
jgi:hypothetical protein